MNADHGQEPPSRPSADPTDNTWILIDDTEEAEPPAADPGDFWTNTTTWGMPSDGGSNAPSGPSEWATGTGEPSAGPGPQSQDQSQDQGGRTQDQAQGRTEDQAQDQAQGWGQASGWSQEQPPGWGAAQEPGGQRQGDPGQGPGQKQAGQEQAGQEQAGQEQSGQGQGWDSFASAGTWNGMRAAAPGAPGGWGASDGWGAPQNDTAQTRTDEPAHDAANDTWFAEDDLADDFTADDDPHDSGKVGVLTDRLPSFSALSFGPAFVTFLVICGSVLLTVSSIIWHPRVP